MLPLALFLSDKQRLRCVPSDTLQMPPFALRLPYYHLLCLDYITRLYDLPYTKLLDYMVNHCATFHLDIWLIICHNKGTNKEEHQTEINGGNENDEQNGT
jgi:hypothetical protein